MKKILLLTVVGILPFYTAKSAPTHATSQTNQTVGLCLGCSIVDPANAISADLTDYARLAVPVAVLGSVRLDLIYPAPGDIGSYVSVVMENHVGGILDATILGGLTLSLYNGASFVESKTFAQVTKTPYQGSTTKTILSWQASGVYDRVRISLGAAIGLSIDIRVYFATHDAVPLPVSFLGFAGRPENGNVNLKWSTVFEFNNDYFSIERSTNGIDFEEIGQLKGAGNSNKLITYSYSDNRPPLGNVYYRIKQTDFDKNFSYSNMIVVNTYNDGKNRMSVFPNPSDGSYVYVAVKDSKNSAKVVLFDGTGKEIPANKYSVEYRNDMYEVRFNEKLSKGIYLVTLEGESGALPGTRLLINQ